MATSGICHLYKITDASTGKFYVGKHKGTVQGNYWGSGVRIKHHIKKYGKKNMRYEILVIGEQDYIFEIERKYLTSEFISKTSNCLNLCKGGIGGNLGGKPHNKGKTTPPEVRLKQSLAKLGKPGVRKGIPHSAETIAKLTGIKKPPLTQETRAKLSIIRAGKKQRLCKCPYCGKVGGIATMPRWHFDRCKHKGVPNWQH